MEPRACLNGLASCYDPCRVTLVRHVLVLAIILKIVRALRPEMLSMTAQAMPSQWCYQPSLRSTELHVAVALREDQQHVNNGHGFQYQDNQLERDSTVDSPNLLTAWICSKAAYGDGYHAPPQLSGLPGTSSRIPCGTSGCL